MSDPQAAAVAIDREHKPQVLPIHVGDLVPAHSGGIFSDTESELSWRIPKNPYGDALVGESRSPPPC
jgi:hypothetical protein